MSGQRGKPASRAGDGGGSVSRGLSAVTSPGVAAKRADGRIRQLRDGHGRVRITALAICLPLGSAWNRCHGIAPGRVWLEYACATTINPMLSDAQSLPAPWFSSSAARAYRSAPPRILAGGARRQSA